MKAATTQWIPAPRDTPQSVALYAVGDVHGHAAELTAINALIAAAMLPLPARHHVIVYLGDYVDRGPDIVETLDILIAESNREDGVKRIFLVGNHDQCLIETLNGDPALDRAFFTAWFDNGGETTLNAIGLEGYGHLIAARRFEELAMRTEEALGPARVEFLSSLLPSHKIGNYVFVHAGIDPEQPLDEQEFADLVLFRHAFLDADADRKHSFCVVHGHSIASPTVKLHRIAVDAGY